LKRGGVIMSNETVKKFVWDELEKKIKEFIYRRLSDEYGPLEFLDDDTELIESKILSSLFLITCLAGIEELSGIQIVNDDVGLEDFSTINKILESTRLAYNRG
jgi:acyl carrier protein